VGIVQSGSMHVVSDDGTEADLNAGDAYVIEPGHDAWITSDGPFVAFEFESRPHLDGELVLRPAAVSRSVVEREGRNVNRHRQSRRFRRSREPRAERRWPASRVPATGGCR
jgi:hypothetical protein